MELAIKTSKHQLTDMTYMFADCSSLTNLDLSSFNTSNVTIMAGLFDRCSSLIELDLSNFDTSRAFSYELSVVNRGGSL